MTDSSNGIQHAVPGNDADPPPWQFTWAELSGSLGDLGTFLPLVLAMSLVCHFDLGMVLICAGLMNLWTGWRFRQPIPVQPMKAIAAVAITQGMRSGEIAAAGLVVGAVMIGLALSDSIRWAAQWVPKAVVRGIQLGVGISLILKAVQWLFGGVSGTAGGTGTAGLPWLGWDSLLIAAVAAAVLSLSLLRRLPVLLAVFLAGFALIYLRTPEVYDTVRLTLPQWRPTWPGGSDWLAGLLQGAIPQIPLTLLNSVIAVCALSNDYFPGRGATPRRIAASVGVMNLLCIPLGGIPMCHGAGGLAAQYRFGARTGGSAVMLGILNIVLGLAFGCALLNVLSAYPQSILAAMLIFGGGTLAWAAKDSLRGCDAMILLTTAAAIVAYDTTIGFLAGLALAWVLRCGKTQLFQHALPGREIVDVDERLQSRVDVAEFLDGDAPRGDAVE